MKLRQGRYTPFVPTNPPKLRRFLAPLALATALLAPALPAAAAPQKDLNDPLLEADGRLRGYTEQTTAEDESSTFLTYGLLVILLGMSAGVMFKTAKRTHLD